MAYIQWLGAAGTVTGSKHLINTSNDLSGKDGLQVLVDCGMFQGQKEWREKNWRDTPIPASAIDAVILTHAHLDHSGWIPRLMKEGFRGPIYATPPTIDLCGILLPDSGYLQEEDAAFHNKIRSSKHAPALPLYTYEEAQEALTLLKPLPYGEVKQLRSGFSFKFARAAHIVGSSMAEITVGVNGSTRQMLFTGDLGRVRDAHIAPGRVLHSGPQGDITTDYLVTESTYGNRLHPTTDPRPEMATLIRDTVKRGGSVVVPAFAVERTQKFLFMVKQLMEAGEIPRLPVFADSPMAINAVKIFLKHREEFSEETRRLIEEFGSPMDWDGFHFALTPQESKRINEQKYPCIIVSANGMAMGGRIQHHLLLKLPDPRNLILFIGFQAPGTRGRQIKDGEPQVKIFGQIVPVRAQVGAVEQMSDHADAPEMLDWMRTFTKAPRQTFVVHGEPAAASALRLAVTSALGWKVDVAEYMGKMPIV